MRANDKISRIKAFLENKVLHNESLEDSLLDAAVYFIIALVLRRRELLKPQNSLQPTSQPQPQPTRGGSGISPPPTKIRGT